MTLGVFGIRGLEWTYRDGRDQMIYRSAGDKNYCILIDPSTHQVISITLPAKSYQEGMTLDATLTQNVDKSVPAIVPLKLTVSVLLVEDHFLILSDADGHTAAMMIGG